MKFLFLTVALLHCVSSSGKRSPKAYSGGLDESETKASESVPKVDGPKVFKDPAEAKAAGYHVGSVAAANKAEQLKFEQRESGAKQVKSTDLIQGLEDKEEAANMNLGLGELGSLDETAKVMDQVINLFLTKKCEACPPKDTKDTSMMCNGKEFGGNNEDMVTTLGNCKTCGDPETGEYPKRYNRTDVSFGIPLKFAARSKWLNRIFQGDKDYKNVLDGNTQEDEHKADPQAKKVEFNKFPNYDVPATATVSEDTLKYVVNYLIGLGDRVPEPISKPIKSKKILECIGAADHVEAQAMEDLFDGAGKQAVFDVILAANYMEIESLLHLGCVKIATLIKGETPETIRQILGDDEASAARDMRRRLLDAMSKAL